MREQLRAIDGVRCTFTGIFERFGTKSAYRGPPIKTLLLRHICDPTDKEVADHVWFVVGKQFGALDLQPGDRVEFCARVREYEKGYKGRREDVWDAPIEKDYKLSHPTKVRKVCTIYAEAPGEAPASAVQGTLF